MQYSIRCSIPHGDTESKAGYYITTGIYRCSILDFDFETLREFQEVKNQRG
ncbi:MAG: hypothetical protein K2L17_01155 [Muribaculaceae bacterium]|nr:hypothetical protein [Muribaculaceae bacterium]